MEYTFKKLMLIGYEWWMHLCENGTSAKGQIDAYDEKMSWPKAKELGDMDNECPACEYATNRGYQTSKCEACPIKVFWGGMDCFRDRSPFQKWHMAKTKKTRSKYAMIIANAFKQAAERGEVNLTN